MLYVSSFMATATRLRAFKISMFVDPFALSEVTFSCCSVASMWPFLLLLGFG